MADKGAPLVDSSKEDQQVLADHAGMSPAESYVKLTCSPSEVAGMGVFVVLLSYASGLPLLIVSVLQQCDWLPSLDNTLFWTILFPVTTTSWLCVLAPGLSCVYTDSNGPIQAGHGCLGCWHRSERPKLFDLSSPILHPLSGVGVDHAVLRGRERS